MSDIFEIHEMSEEDIKHEYITKALEAKWDAKKITMETEIWKAVKKRNQNLHISASPLNNFTDGKVRIKGNIPSRDKGKRCDYILWHNKGTPLAIVEAKDNNHSSSFGLQQAISYGVLLDVPFVYTSNGSTFFEHDFTTGLEKEIPLSDFPTAEELMARWRGVDAEKIAEVENRMEYAIDGNTKFYDVPLCFEENLMNTPFYSGADCYPPRYYQRNAVNRTLEAIAKQQTRILIAMATGTGKTYTAFQLVWRLIESGTKKKVLYLADRNNLVDQSIQQDFKPLEKVIHKINFQKEDKSKISAYQVYFALYQQLDSAKRHGEDDEETEEEIELEVSKYKEYFDPDFFDLIIVDECHRGSAKADSRWRKILEYFNGATQIGMTATPKETKYVSNIDYFGEPVYSYSLKQGIEDGFLAPFKVINVHTNIDDGWRPRKGQKDIHGNEIEDREYNLSDYDYNIIIQDRIDEVAAEITKYLKETDRMSKTIVFCPTEDAADRMRVALNNLNTDMILKDNQGNVKEQYVVRITGSDKYGKDKLDYFISVSQPYPVIATTSKLLSTGSDCKAVIVPDGFLFGNDNAKNNLKKKLLTDFNLHTIVRLPGSVFSPYTSITTNILFFNNEEPTGKTWFYRVDIPGDRKHFSKTKPMELKHFDDCLTWWNDRKEITDEEGNPKAKCYTVQELIDSNYNFDVCGYPHEEEEILSVAETIQNYEEKRSKLNADIDNLLAQITELHQKAQKGEL